MASYTDESVINRAMLNGLRYMLRDNLKKDFQKVADEVIEEAIKEAMKDFEIAVETYYNPLEMGRTIRVLLEDKRS